MTRRITLVVGLCVLGIVGVASAASSEPASNAQAGKRAQLQMMDLQPLTVRGVGFVAGERVHVNAAARGGAYSRTKVANANGVFSVKFPITAGVCRGYYSIRAYGSRGSRAFAITRLPQLDCMAPDSARSTGRSTT
jgi:hypothetical protein